MKETQMSGLRRGTIGTGYGVWLLLLLGTVVGCAKDQPTLGEARQWSSQRAWDTIDSHDPNMIERLFGMLPDDLGDAAKSADSQFADEAKEASRTTPPGGLELLLERLRVSFAPTIVEATAGLTNGASGIIVLGDFIGPDGKPIQSNVDSQVAVDRFIDQLQQTPGIAGNWFIITLSVEQMKQVLAEAGAEPGEAVKVSTYDFVYDPANIYFMEMLISATPYDPQHMVTYTGNARLSQVMSRVRVPGRGDGEVKFYYQPFAKEWLEYDEEMQRRLRDAEELEAQQRGEPAA
jgi:hypothetical protein